MKELVFAVETVSSFDIKFKGTCTTFTISHSKKTLAKAYKTIIIIIIIIQSALQPLWVLAFSTIVEYSQQESFYRVPLPAARQNPKPGGPVIITLATGSPHRLKRRKRTPAAEGGTMGEKFPRILSKVATSTSILG